MLKIDYYGGDKYLVGDLTYQDDQRGVELHFDDQNGGRWPILKVKIGQPIYVHRVNPAETGIPVDDDGYPIIEGYTRTATAATPA